MSLHDLLVAQIATNGPMRISNFMADCLLHPELATTLLKIRLARLVISLPRPKSRRCLAN